MPNGTVNFTNNSSVRDGSTLNYQWNFGDGNSSTETNPGHVYAAISNYNVRLTVTTQAGCTDDSVRVFSAFFDKPVALFSVTPDKLCQGNQNVFTDQSYAPNSSIAGLQWNFGDGSTSQSNNPTKTYSNAGIYVVELVVTNPENCISDPFRDTVTVYVQPVVDAGPSFVVPQGTRIQFRPVVNDSTSINFIWTPGSNLSNATSLRPTLIAMEDQTYVLTATGEGNCTASDDMYVKILKPLEIPNAFSPNGDGQNDTWQIDHLTDYPGCTVEVFNRYGQSVYASKGYPKAWDGTMNGKPLPVATYYYIIKLQNGFKHLGGSVTIIR
jgi:gliding motility-associated-like protein